MGAELIPDVSICIATYRRPQGLARLLVSLSRLNLPDAVTLEVLVVDNDGDGGARECAHEVGPFADTVRWFVEPERNIAIARNRALAAARGRWLAFVDDDEFVDEDWLAVYWEQAEQGVADGFFGPVEPQLEAGGSDWIAAAAFNEPARHPTGTPLGSGEMFAGNAFIQRALFADRRFDPSWGLTGGEDTELFERMLADGAHFAWCDEARLRETIPLRRQNLRWLMRRAFSGGASHTRLQRKWGRASASGIALRSASVLCLLAPLLPLSLLGGRASAARVWLRICTQVGHLWATAGRSYQEYGGLEATASLD